MRDLLGAPSVCRCIFAARPLPSLGHELPLRKRGLAVYRPVRELLNPRFNPRQRDFVISSDVLERRKLPAYLVPDLN